MKSRPEARKSSMALEDGLCCTCEHDPTCTFPRAPGRPVLECEEFASAPAHARRLEGERRGEEPTQTRPAAARSEGLCSNCDRREGCTLPDARSGVVDCEEYL